ncbi:MAG: prephenate dehydrogenase/arogenate dehydrogenase family protein [Luteolibacter sp.]
MNADFSHVTILGGGLLGGSLCLALSGEGALENPPHVTLWARREETAEEARQSGIPHATTDLAAAVKDAKLIVLAVPVGAMPALVSQIVAAGVPENCLFTDVGSVKGVPHREIPPLLAPHRLPFIGSHPMAGSERNGLSAIDRDLFNDAACLLTNDENAPAPLAEALERFWQAIGCRTSWMSAAAHDSLVARISHLPHILAASGARVCLQTPADGKFGGGGLRDTTRVAGGNPTMWAEILTENREALIGPLQETLADLRSLLANLETGDQNAVLHWLEHAKTLRSALAPSR